MNIDTPLEDVARMLPPTAATALGRCPYGVQTHVLTLVKGSIVSWEQAGVVLDPIAYEVVLDAFVLNLASSLVALYQTANELAHLQRAFAELRNGGAPL